MSLPPHHLLESSDYNSEGEKKEIENKRLALARVRGNDDSACCLPQGPYLEPDTRALKTEPTGAHQDPPLTKVVQVGEVTRQKSSCVRLGC